MVQGVQEKLCFSQLTATPPSPTSECWRGGKLSRILGKKTQYLMNNLYHLLNIIFSFLYWSIGLFGNILKLRSAISGRIWRRKLRKYRVSFE